MQGREDVFEYIIDGTSGLAPGDVSGSCIAAGVCSAGTVGKGYLLGRNSDLEGLLGVGPLVDRLRDLFATAGQDAIVIAVPVTGNEGTYITDLVHTGTGPDAAISGVAGDNADVVVEIVLGGELATAMAKVSTDGGATWGEAEVTPATGQIAIGDTGTTLVLEAAEHVAGDTYAYTVRTSIGPVAKVGTGPDILVAGTVTAAAQVILQILTAGGRNEGTYQLSVDGGDNYGIEKTIPVDGLIQVPDTGVTITWPETDAVLGDTYSFDLLAPAPTVVSLLEALETPLSLFDIEFVHVAGPSDSVDWAAMAVFADELFNVHRPTWLLPEARLPYANEDLNDWTTALVADAQGFSHRFVAPVSAFGEISDSTGQRKVRSAGGLAAGRNMAIPVQRSMGRVRDGAISQLTLPDGYTDTMQTMLKDAGYITATRYAGLDGVYWGSGRTMADATSDYQLLEAVRVTFKAIRLMRIQALKSLHDEAGDLLLGNGASGIAYLKANIGNALNTMVKAVPQELAGFVIDIPAGQDVVNNGLATITTLVGIPTIPSIKLYSQFVWAGSAFDPRLSEAA